MVPVFLVHVWAKNFNFALNIFSNQNTSTSQDPLDYVFIIVFSYSIWREHPISGLVSVSLAKIDNYNHIFLSCVSQTASELKEVLSYT